jgi:hypothetical protein
MSVRWIRPDGGDQGLDWITRVAILAVLVAVASTYIGIAANARWWPFR